MKTIIHKRFEYYNDTTIGKILIDSEFVCYTLEDTIRPYGVKVDKHTGIPANDNTGYNVAIRYSPHFKRDMIVLYTEDDKRTLDFGGIVFTDIMVHGGNKHEDTDGCILVAYNHQSSTIWGTAETEIFNTIKDWLDSGETVMWVTIN